MDEKEYIDRDQAVRKALDACIKVVGHGISQVNAVDIADEIESIPAADVVEVRHGEWAKDGNRRTCSECAFKYWANGGLFNYCPKCGAKMDGKGEGG